MANDGHAITLQFIMQFHKALAIELIGIDLVSIFVTIPVTLFEGAGGLKKKTKQPNNSEPHFSLFLNRPLKRVERSHSWTSRVELRRVKETHPIIL